MENAHVKPGKFVVTHREDSDLESYWQPMPANGWAEVHLSPEKTGSSALSMGIQVVAPGSFIREHWHDKNEEALHVLRGSGTAYIDGEPHPMRPGTTMYLGPWRKHKFVNNGTEPMHVLWVLTPPGLENFFAGIGRPREIGQPVPEPFERPQNVAEIERRTVFAGSDGEESKQATVKS
jgi:quercetin dioxygenase-like cupin family protein